MRMFKCAAIGLGLMVTTACFVSTVPPPPEGEFSFEYSLQQAENGDVTQQYNIGQAYADGIQVEVDRAKAIEWWRKAAAQGFAPAQYNLARAYETGNGVEQDFAQAKALYEKASAQGDGPASHNIGVLYTEGKGFEKDLKEAKVWFERGAEQGYYKSQFNLAVINARGMLGPPDLVAAHKGFTAIIDNPEAVELVEQARAFRTEVEGAMSADDLAAVQ